MNYTSKKANAILRFNKSYVVQIHEYDNCFGLHEYTGFEVSNNRDEAIVFTTKKARKLIDAFNDKNLKIESVKLEGKC